MKIQTSLITPKQNNPQIGVLKDPNVVLEPLSTSYQFDYMFDLMESDYRRYAGFDFEAQTFKNAKHIWIAKVRTTTGDVALGVVYLQYFELAKSWTLDAYRDDTLYQTMGICRDFSFRAGRLVVDWFMQNYPGTELWSAVDVINRAAILTLKKLNFREHGNVNTEIGVFTLLRRGV